MSRQLSNPIQQLIEAASKQAASKKTTAVLARHQERSKAQGTDRFVLADVSSSMSESAGAQTKIALLRRALSDPAIDWNAHRLVAFHSFPEEIATPYELPMPQGSTALHRALEMIEQEKPAYTLVISDGQPDDKKAALAAADRMTGKIDVLYIGPDDDYDAISFMYQLAGRTGGRVMVRDIVKERQLPPGTVAGLLDTKNVTP